MVPVMDEAEERKIIRDLELRIEERRRQVYGDEGNRRSLTLDIIGLALFIFIIGIFIFISAFFGQEIRRRKIPRNTTEPRELESQPYTLKLTK